MREKKKRVLAILWSVALCLALISGYLTFINCGYTELCFVDVGQGDCCFVKTERGGNILVDGGDEGTGGYVLEPFLRKKLARELDAVFVSHMHEDHTSGIIELLEADFPIKRIYLPARAKNSDEHKRWVLLSNRNDTELVYLSAGDCVELDNIDFYVVASGYIGDEQEENDNSLVLRMECGENSVLFTGDMTRRYENQLLEDETIDADFLKTAHHGSYTSSGERFLEAVSPEISIISVGENNRYNHPSKHTLTTMDKLGIPVVRTDYDGTVTIIMTEKDVKNISYSRAR